MPKVKKPNPAPVSKANKGSKGNNASKPTNTVSIEIPLTSLYSVVMVNLS